MNDDLRPRVALDRPVNLAQLADELGTALCASDDEVVVADHESAVTVEELAAALAVHVPARQVDAEAEFRAAIEAATSIADIKAALLGTSRGPGAAARPTAR